MARNRLPVFARKPAPVQATFAGYPGGTGLSAIDYRLTDPYLDPPGQTDSDYIERSIRLRETFWCYDPAAMTFGATADPPPGPLPALTNRHITFGCLNNICKINNGVLSLWAKVLLAVKNSRLLLLADDGGHRQRLTDRFAQHGIEPARIQFVAHCPRPAYMAYHGNIDIGLDTFPYNGHTTSLDSFWMGAPVVTLVGRTVVGRAGLSQLSNLALTELAAANDAEYVRVATELAGDLPRLITLRADLRERMLQSPLTDARRYTRNIEHAFRAMWRGDDGMKTATHAQFSRTPG
jgi:protein O-GlcNAc transferase